MFAQAYAIAGAFTLPVVISSRLGNDVCNSVIGASVVLNRDGWILTVAHLMREIERQVKSVQQHRAHDGNIRELEHDTVSDRPYRKRRVRTFHPPPKNAVKNHSVWWGRDGAQLRDMVMLPAADLAIGRLEPFDADSIAHYPIFKNPATGYTPGRSLCRLGFPFHEIKPTFDAEKNAFVLPQGATPLPLFPIEGIFTRVVIAPMPDAAADPKQTAQPGKFIETSSPGLAGQSGGPIVDTSGKIWALQSHTRHYALGFTPAAPTRQSPAQKEHQFLNAGLGVHAELILQFLKHQNIEHEIAD